MQIAEECGFDVPLGGIQEVGGGQGGRLNGGGVRWVGWGHWPGGTTFSVHSPLQRFVVSVGYLLTNEGRQVFGLTGFPAPPPPFSRVQITSFISAIGEPWQPTQPCPVPMLLPLPLPALAGPSLHPTLLRAPPPPPTPNTHPCPLPCRHQRQPAMDLCGRGGRFHAAAGGRGRPSRPRRGD